MLAVLGAFISLFIGFFDPWSCFLVVPLLLYLSSSDAFHSLEVCCHLIFVCHVSPSYSMFVFTQKPRFCGMHGLLLSYSHVLPLAWASKLETTALGARLHGPSILRGRESLDRAKNRHIRVEWFL